MLCELHIKNLAIIKDLSLTFGRGFSILTGETGAGKSIILQSLNLLSGAKGNSTVVRSGTDKAIIEAVFEPGKDSPVPSILAEGGFESEEELIIKRIIGANGRSRFYINGSLANAKTVRHITSYLISIASQHDHQQLLHPKHHLEFVDTVGNLAADHASYLATFKLWQSTKQEWTSLLLSQQDKEQRKEFLVYQIKEIDDCNLEQGEDTLLDEEKDILRSSTDNQQLAAKSLDLLFAANQNLSQIRSNLQQIAALDHNAASIHEAISEQSYLLEEHFGELRAYADNIPHNPARLEEVTERIAVIANLKRKYGINIEAILTFASESKKELLAIENCDETIERLEQEIKALETKLTDEANDLTQKRHKICKRLTTEMNAELASLCLKDGHFEIQIQQTDFTSLGQDSIEFFFSANHGEQVKPLKEVASGGELSRLLLGLKCILAQRDQVHTIIFDEIDSGISGEAAESVALKIQQLAGHHQVICISHLVQIASLADDHFRVGKEIFEDRTNTTITLLDPEQTIESLAHMLDGTSVSDSTRTYVQKLIARKQK